MHVSVGSRAQRHEDLMQPFVELSRQNEQHIQRAVGFIATYQNPNLQSESLPIILTEPQDDGGTTRVGIVRLDPWLASNEMARYSIYNLNSDTARTLQEAVADEPETIVERFYDANSEYSSFAYSPEDTMPTSFRSSTDDPAKSWIIDVAEKTITAREYGLRTAYRASMKRRFLSAGLDRLDDIAPKFTKRAADPNLNPGLVAATAAVSRATEQ